MRPNTERRKEETFEISKDIIDPNGNMGINKIIKKGI